VGAPEVGFAHDTNAVTLLRPDAEPVEIDLASKRDVARAVIDTIVVSIRSDTSTGLCMSTYTFTSESVTEGHPDKMADQVSDAVLDAILTEDPDGRVACETLLTTGLCVIAGEITTTAYVDIPKIARETINGIGYDNAIYGFDGNTCGVIVSIDEQSPDIAQGVDTSEEVRGGKSGEDQLNLQGAGDQGMMFGYACNETDDLMPLPIWTAHRLSERLAEVRKSGQVPYLRPDGKTQVTYEYHNGWPVALKAVLISTQHQDGVDRDTVIRPDLIDQVIRPIIPERFADDDFEIYVNPTGQFVRGGPFADAGLTGRKIIVDTYGGMGRHGGGAFSGKDPSRSTARPPTPAAGSPSTSSPPAPPIAARCSSPTRSAWRSR
jgi:S-adenosylmethionine synthetase